MGIDKKRLDDQIASLSTLKYVKEKERELAIGNNEAKSKYDELIDAISEKLRVERQLLLMGRGVTKEQDAAEKPSIKNLRDEDEGR